MGRGVGCGCLWVLLWAAFAISKLAAFGLTSDQLFNFAPLPAGSLPNEPVYTPVLRACIFDSIQRSLSNFTLSDQQTNARFLRLIFHDCASGGCNGSIMKLGEQKAFVNTFLSGYDKVQIVKAAADSACGSNLSYADTIIAGGILGVYLSGGPNITQYVRLGRVDTDLLDDPNRLPTAFTLNDDLVRTFAVLGLNVEELVALSGAHTLGKATCANVVPRIGGDPYASESFLYGLTNQCRTLIQQLSLDLSPTLFDNSYYKVMKNNEGILLTDEGLYFGNATTAYASQFALNQTAFFDEFAVGLLKMSLIGLRPPSVSNLSAGLDRTMPINASIILNGTASSHLFEIADLQAALDEQLSMANSQVVITSILPAMNDSTLTNVTFWVIPSAINYNGTIPLQEAAVILSALNATSADPSRLNLKTSSGPIQSLQVLSFPPVNLTVPSQTFSLASFTLPQTLAALQQNVQTLTGYIARTLGLHPSETLRLTLSNPVGGSGTLVTLILVEPGILTGTGTGNLSSTGVPTGQQRVGQLQTLLTYGVGNKTLVNETQFGTPGNVLLTPANSTVVSKVTGPVGNNQGGPALVGSSLALGPHAATMGAFVLSTVLACWVF